MLVRESLALRIVRDVALYTIGKPIPWVPVETIARRLVLRDEVVIDQAIELARAKGWLLVECGRSVSLTAEGRRKVKV